MLHPNIISNWSQFSCDLLQNVRESPSHPPTTVTHSLMNLSKTTSRSFHSSDCIKLTHKKFPKFHSSALKLRHKFGKHEKYIQNEHHKKSDDDSTIANKIS